MAKLSKALLKFTKTWPFIVVTDIANYYDTISYEHLRNVISSMTGAEECVLDMLIFVLSHLLWQPDYTPRVEIGLPQMNLDAPRLLAHCFLYELDAYLEEMPGNDFARFMDDIDVGVGNVIEAKRILMSIDLILQTKQIRLNAGKTQILSHGDAVKHFRIFENAWLDVFSNRINRKISTGVSIAREQSAIAARVNRDLKRRAFDSGNGDKILKRLLNLAAKVGARISEKDLGRVLRSRPSVRETVFDFIRSQKLNASNLRVLNGALRSQMFTDEAALVDLANNLVETLVDRRAYHPELMRLISAIDDTVAFGFYAKIWLQSKYCSTPELLATISSRFSVWISNESLGRLVGALTPLYLGSPIHVDYLRLIRKANNSGAMATHEFHTRLVSDKSTFNAMFNILKTPNPSRRTGITHPKFLCLLSALQNQGERAALRMTLRSKNNQVMKDIYYRGVLRDIKP